MFTWELTQSMGKMVKQKPPWEQTNFKPWGLQGNLKKERILTEGDIKIIAANNFKPDKAKYYLKNRALFILTYLTAGRISEVLALRKKDLRQETRRGRDLLLISMINRKHRKRHFKDIPIPLDNEYVLLEFLNEYLSKLKDDDLLFWTQVDRSKSISRLHAYRILRRYTGFNCHWLRHLRLTHLVVNYDFNEQLLTQFAGWTNSLPAKNYMEIRWTNILDKY